MLGGEGVVNISRGCSTESLVLRREKSGDETNSVLGAIRAGDEYGVVYTVTTRLASC